MATTAVTPTTCSRSTSLDLTAAGTAVPAATSDRHSFVNDGTTLLRVKNTNASACTVTVYFQGTDAPKVDGVTLTGTSAGRQYTVAATTGDRLIGPFPTATYGTTAIVGYSTTSGTTVTVVQPTN